MKIDLVFFGIVASLPRRAVRRKFVGEVLRQHMLERDLLFECGVAALPPPDARIGFELDRLLAFEADIGAIEKAENIFRLDLGKIGGRKRKVRRRGLRAPARRQRQSSAQRQSGEAQSCLRPRIFPRTHLRPCRPLSRPDFEQVDVP